MYRVVLDSISDKMAELEKTGKHGDIIKTDTKTLGYYVIKFLSEAYTIQEYRTCKIKISTYGELFVKAQYMNGMKDKTKWYW